MFDTLDPDLDPHEMNADLKPCRKLLISPPLWAGVSLTSSACALVYLVDRAGVRTTTEQFYALAGNNVAHTLFRQTHLFAAIFYESSVFFQQIRRDKLCTLKTCFVKLSLSMENIFAE